MHLATTLPNDALADVESHADSFLVLGLSTSDFAKLLQGFNHLFLSDSLSSVDDVHFELFTCVVIRSYDSNRSINSEFKRVLGKVDQHLLQSYLVAHEELGERFLPHTWVRIRHWYRKRFAFDLWHETWHHFILKLRVLHLGLRTEHTRDEL